MAGVKPHFIVFANEKGGTGKSTTAVHSAVALAAAGRRVAAIDLDTRQRTLGRYLDNRAASIERLGTPLPRSEEHTSELQSLMRISYAVFCLNKKKERRHEL